MASITAVPMPAIGVVRVFVDWKPTYLYDLVHIYRVTPDGREHEIIGSPAHLSGGYLIAYDTSAPFDVPLTYRVRINSPVVALDTFDRVVLDGWGSDNLGNAYTLSGGTTTGFTAIADTFSRTVANGWGTADSGQTWSIAGGTASEYSTNGTVGQHTHNANSVTRWTTIGSDMRDVEIVTFVSVPTIATGGTFQVGVMGRYTNNSNFYLVELMFGAAGVLTMRSQKVVAGAFTNMSGDVDTGITYTNGTVYGIRVRIAGTYIRARAWLASGAEPNGWTIYTEDSSISVAGAVGARSILSNTNSNAKPITISYHDFSVTPIVDYLVDLTGGQMNMSSRDVARNTLLPMVLTDAQIEATITPPVNSTVSGNAAVMVLRWTDTEHYYEFAANFNPLNQLKVEILSRTPGVTTSLNSADVGTYTANTPVRIKAQAVGNLLRMKAWTGSLEPEEWQALASDMTHTSGQPGYRAIIFPNNTNQLPQNMRFHDAKVTSLTGTDLVTADAVELEAGRDGWIRDPQDATRSVRLDNCDTHTFTCLNAERFVFFQGLDEEQNDSATGVFEVVDSENPLTVAQSRKSTATSLRFVSTTLADIPAIRALFRPGRDLVLSLPTDYGWGIETYGTDVFTAGDLTMSRLNRRDMRKPQRLWSVPIRVVDADETYPSGGMGSNNVPVPGATYADLKALGLTYGELKAAGKKYIDWSQGMFV